MLCYASDVVLCCVMLRCGVMLWCCVMLWHFVLCCASTNNDLNIFGHPAFREKKTKTCYAPVLCYATLCYGVMLRGAMRYAVGCCAMLARDVTNMLRRVVMPCY